MARGDAIAMRDVRRHTVWIATILVAGVVHAADTPSAQPTKPAPSAAKSVPAATSPRKLDLKVRDVSELYTQDQILAFLALTRGDDGLEVVDVPGERMPTTPAVWGGLAAPFWAFLNPLQSWRIIAPVPPDRLHAADVTPEARPQPRDPFRP